VPITITGAIIDNEARLRGLGDQIGAAVRAALQGDLTKAVDTLILGGGPA
jgi:hypothetical protein